MVASESIVEMFAELSTPLVADACVRHDVPLRAAPPGIAPVAPGRRIAGRVLPSRHYGSVDIFLEAFGHAEAGDVLVIDNGGRADEACVGDLTVLEAARAIWTTERAQAGKIAAGETLRRQTEFDDYLARRGANPSYTFRQHLRRIGGAIEE